MFQRVQDGAQLREPTPVPVVLAYEGVIVACHYTVEIRGEEVLEAFELFWRFDFCECGFDLGWGWIRGVG